jgi:phosphomannomutase
MTLSCFKAYDIRGAVPREITEDFAYRLGAAYSRYVQPKRVVVGRDIRLSSAMLCNALIRGLTDSGVHVLDIGLCGTEQVYFATFAQQLDGGIMVTASHNPKDYNGFKLVREDARPIGGDSGLPEIAQIMETGGFSVAATPGTVTLQTDPQAYINHLLSYIDRAKLKPLRIVCNAGNGGAGMIIDQLAPHLPFEFIRLQHAPDGNFPQGVPNPLLPERRVETIKAVQQHKADLGIAWDGDFDRCFFFDERGEFIEGYYIVGLLASALLAKSPGSKIIHDLRLTWNTIEQVQQAGGIPVPSKTGHAFIKAVMRTENALYGGEMSAHHYFRDFAYCDSGMLPWLILCEHLSTAGQPLSALVKNRMAAYPCSGEINFTVQNPKAVMDTIVAAYAYDGAMLDQTDGISLEFPQWRFSLRASNTEPLLRLNLETRGDRDLMLTKTSQLSAFIQQLGQRTFL